MSELSKMWAAGLNISAKTDIIVFDVNTGSTKGMIYIH